VQGSVEIGQGLVVLAFAEVSLGAQGV